MLIGLISPAVMNVDFDLEIAMAVCAALVLWRARHLRRHYLVGAALTVLLVLGADGLVMQQFYDGTVLTRRNFYGALHVFEWDQEGAGMARSLANGIIVHGTQYLAPSLVRRPTEYYGNTSGIGHAMAALQKDPRAAPHRRHWTRRRHHGDVWPRGRCCALL